MSDEAHDCCPDGDAPIGDHMPGHHTDCHDCALCHVFAHASLMPVQSNAFLVSLHWVTVRLLALPDSIGPPDVAAFSFRSRAPPIHSA